MSIIPTETKVIDVAGMADNFNPQEIYKRDRLDGEYDVVESIRQAMLDSGASRESIEYFDNHYQIVKARSLNADAQVMHCLLFVTAQLATIDNGYAIDARQAIAMQMRPSEWISIFKGKVLPLFIEHDLPKRL